MACLIIHLFHSINSEPVSELESYQRILNQPQDFSLQTLLLLDLSGSVTTNYLTALREAVTKFIDIAGIKQNYIGIFGFAGGKDLIKIQQFTLDKAQLKDSLTQLGPQQDTSSNVYGGIIQSIDLINERLKNPSSIFNEGLMVTFTDGTDRWD